MLGCRTRHFGTDLLIGSPCERPTQDCSRVAAASQDRAMLTGDVCTALALMTIFKKGYCTLF